MAKTKKKKVTSTKKAQKPKKSKAPIVIIIIVILLACCLVSCVVGGIFLLVINTDSAEKSFKKAVEDDIFVTVDSFKYEQTASFTVGIEFPTKPEHDYSYTEKNVAKGEYDVRNESSHEVQDQTLSSDAKTETYFSEAWFVDGIGYRKDGKNAQIEKIGTREEMVKEGFSYYAQGIEIFRTLSGSEDFELVGEENINGVDCYHIKLTLGRENVGVWIEWFKTFVEGQFDLEAVTDNVTVGDITYDLWIKKGGDQLLKSETRISELLYDVTDPGSVEAYTFYRDLVSTTTYTNWGEEVNIETPI
jgi:hypothetical protein